MRLGCLIAQNVHPLSSHPYKQYDQACAQSERKYRTGESLEDYDAAMIAITQRFSATLAAIAEAVQQGKNQQRTRDGNDR